MSSVDPAAFGDDENWHGGFYELAVLVGPRDDARLDAALRAAWNDARLDGCYADRDREPTDQERVPCSSVVDEGGHLRGLAQLPNAGRVVCGSVVVREEDSRLDWIDFYLPMGALARADPRVGGFPFPFGDNDGGSLAWRHPIDQWLAAMAARIYLAAPFEYAPVGFEVSGESLPDVASDDRYVGVVRPLDGSLAYVPATR